MSFTFCFIGRCKAVVARLGFIWLPLIRFLEIGLAVRGSSLIIEQAGVHIDDLVNLSADLLLVGPTIVNRLQFLDMPDPVLQGLFRRFCLWLFEGLDGSRPNLPPLLIRRKTLILGFVVDDRLFEDAFWLPRETFRSLVVGHAPES